MIKNFQKVVLFSKRKFRSCLPAKHTPLRLVASTALLSCIAFLIAPHHALAFELSPYKATYKAKIKGFTTNLSRELEQEKDGTWQLTNKATLFFADFKERSRFTTEKNRVIPSRYTYRDELLDYDWQVKKVTAIDGEKNKVLSLKDNMLDKLSYLPQVRIDFLSDQQQEKNYSLLDGTRIKGYHVKKVSEEKITTPTGTYDTIVLEQVRGESSKTRIWLDKNNRGLIIQLRKFNDNKLTYSLDLIKKK